MKTLKTSKIKNKAHQGLIKISGAGNTFVLMDLLHTASITKTHKAKLKQQTYKTKLKHLKVSLSKKQIQKICHSKKGWNTDGLILLENKKQNIFKWKFYNKDGSKALICGNATVCLAYYVNRYHRHNKNLFFKINSFKYQSKKINSKIWIQWPIKINAKVSKLNNKTFNIINSGVPHCLFPVPTLKKWQNKDKLKKQAKKLRQTFLRIKKNYNITFFKKTNSKLCP